MLCHLTRTAQSSLYPLTNFLIFVAPGGLALGAGHSLMLKIDGSVWATGVNQYGQLGDGSRKISLKPEVKMTQHGVTGGTAVTLDLKKNFRP